MWGSMWGRDVPTGRKRSVFNEGMVALGSTIQPTKSKKFLALVVALGTFECGAWVRFGCDPASFDALGTFFVFPTCTQQGITAPRSGCSSRFKR